MIDRLPHVAGSLEWIRVGGLLSRVFSTQIRAGVRAGLLAAAATGGAVFGFGMRRSDWSGPFDALGTQVLLGLGIGPSSGVWPVIVGVAAHASWMVIWGITFVVLTRATKPAATVVFAVLLGLGVAVIARSVVPAAFGAVEFAFLPAIQVALCVLLLAAGLVAGRALSHPGQRHRGTLREHS